jgi:branched-chain amino acid aminotransferase
LGIISHLRKANDSLANLKSCNALIYAVAAQEAKTNKWNDALLCNTAGNIIESTIANIFWLKDKQVYTPPLTEGCVAGVMRRHIINSVPVVEQPLSATTIHNADGVFLTNAIRRIKWVRNIGDATYGSELIATIHSRIFK